MKTLHRVLSILGGLLAVLTLFALFITIEVRGLSPNWALVAFVATLFAFPVLWTLHHKQTLTRAACLMTSALHFGGISYLTKIAPGRRVRRDTTQA
jgi:hypothetical protein